MDWFIEAYPELTICDTTRQVVTQEQFDKGILVPLAWPQPEHYDYRNEEFPTFPSSMEFRSSRKDQQGFVVEANLNKAIEAGAKTFYGCFGTKLLKDGDGRVTGVIIRDAQNGNKYIQLNAAKGVILATGDNSGDEKIMKHFAPEVVEKQIMNMGAMGMLGVDVEGNSVETGDGLRMGAWIGAKVQDHHAPITHHMGSGMGITPFLQLNKRGERFMNECIPGQQLETRSSCSRSALPSSCTTPSGASRSPICRPTTAACAISSRRTRMSPTPTTRTVSTPRSAPRPRLTSSRPTRWRSC